MGTDPSSAQRYCVSLVDTCCHTFAVEGEVFGRSDGSHSDAGILVAIQVRYTDGFTDNIFSDGEWHATQGAPARFEQVACDDRGWKAAFVQGPYPEKPSRGITIPPAFASPGSGDGPSLPSANWIWTSEVENPAEDAPDGGRAFCKKSIFPMANS
jgi:hypothetical protein